MKRSAVLILSAIFLAALSDEVLAGDWGASFAQGFSDSLNKNIQDDRAYQRQVAEINMESQRKRLLEHEIIEQEIKEESLEYDHELRLSQQEKAF